MTRYADPAACPDCRAPIAPDLPACGSCGLPLRGPLAQDLFTTLLRADALLDRLRAAAAGTGAPEPYPRPAAPAGPAAAPTPASGRRSGLSGAAVPAILLSLGALCLLIAGSVFLAVAWAVLGVQGRTVVVIAMTAACALAVVLFARRRLRVAAESFTVLTLGFLALAVLGVHHSGWLGGLSPDSDGGLAALVGGVVAVVGYLAAAAGRRAGRGGLVSAEVGAVVGASVAVLGLVSMRSVSSEAVLAVATVLSLAGAGRARSRQRRLATALLAGSAALWWSILLLVGVVRAVAHPRLAELWGDLEVWPLLAASVIAAGLAALPLVGRTPRIAAAATAVAIGVLVLAIPAFPESSAVTVTTWLVLLAGLAGATTWPIRGPWRWTTVPAMLLCATLPAVALLEQAALAWSAFVPDAAWQLAAFDPLPAASPSVPTYLLAPSLAILGATAALLARIAGRPPRRRTLGVAGAALLAGGLVLSLILLQVALIVVVLVLVALALAVTAQALLSTDERWVGAVGGLLLLALVGALANPVTTALALAGIVAGSAYLVAQDRHPVSTTAALVAFPPALAGLIWTLAELGGLDAGQRAYPALLLIGVLAIVRPAAAGEASGAASAVVIALASIRAAEDPLLTTAIVLTLAGGLVSVSALVNPARRELGWLGGLLLAAATWVRLGQLGVTDPEPYTLPTALALLGVGLIGLRRRPELTSRRAWGPGLALALVPSLIWALADPLSVRALLLGGCCLALVIGGALGRLSAPLVAGAVTGAVLALRLGSPWLGSVHPWITIAIAGSLLLGAGITWESRIRDVRRSAAYLRRLR